MVDRYTKVVLTVIAFALVTLAAQQFTRPAAALGEGCGSSGPSACYVTTASFDYLNVRVK